jgi:hypothetical protein
MGCFHHLSASLLPGSQNFFSKLKALLRRAAERSFDGLIKAIASILDATSPQECSNYFDASGYVYT